MRRSGHLRRATADAAGFHVNIEYPLESLCPSHGHMALCGCLLVLAFCCFLATLAPLRRRYPRSVFTVRRKYSVKSRQVDSGLGYQCGQFGDKVHRLDKIAGSDFEQPQAGPKGGGQDARSNITWVVPSRYGVFSS